MAVTSREVTMSLELAIKAAERCRELLIIADTDADDLAEYDAACQGMKFTLEAWLDEHPLKPLGRPAKAKGFP